MSQFLIRHALDNVWCSPDQDRQATIVPARAGPPNGQTSSVRVDWENVELPEPDRKGRFWRVFILGPLPEHIYNMPRQSNIWMPLVDVCRQQKMLIQLFTKRGYIHPLSMGYLRQIHDGTIIIALRFHKNIDIDFEQEDLYVRLYSNAYFESSRWTNGPNNTLQTIIANGGVIGEDLSAAQFNQGIQSIPRKEVGHTFIYVNGRLISRVLPSMLKPGDVVEYVHDRSVKKVETWEYETLDPFQSVLDAKDKYILYPTQKGDVIDFRDDVDFFFGRINDQDVWESVYYAQNEPDSIRMLTHNSYSIVDQYLDAYIDQNDFLDEDYHAVPYTRAAKRQIQAFVRHAGYVRPLINEHHRINELYKLPLDKIREAMTGVNSLVPEWRAEELEASSYPAIMRARWQDIDTDLVADAYGYNAATKVSYPAVHRTIGAGTSRHVKNEWEFIDMSVSSFNADGDYIDVRGQQGGEIVNLPAPVQNARYVEIQSGRFSADRGMTWYGHVNVTSQRALDQVGHRCYVCGYRDGNPTEEWTDVTGDDRYYEIAANGRTIIWDEAFLNGLQQYPATRIGNHVWIVKKVPFQQSYLGTVEFSLSTKNNWRWPLTSSPDVTLYRPDTIPYGQLNVYMDNRYLIEDVDYYVDYPRIVIVKAPPRLPSEGLTIAVHQTAFCHHDMSRVLPRDVGWVRAGLVSGNGRYDTRNDRNFKVFVGGQFRMPDQVRWSEDATGGVLQTNGQPYAIVDVIQPSEAFVGRDTMEWREESVVVDQRVEDYIDVMSPGTQPGPDDPIPGLYRLMEPLVSVLIHEFNRGTYLNNGELDTDYSINEIDEWIGPFKYLLDYSPTLKEANPNFVSILPHQYATTMSLTSQQYAFVTRVIKNYLHGKVPLSPYVTVE